MRITALLVVLGLVLAHGARAETFTFQTSISGPKRVSGALHLPAGAGKRVPVVIVIHGTAGPDSRYTFHRGALLAAGFATFEVDFKRGVFRGPFDRPRSPAFVPAVQSAAALMRADQRIDGARIGLLGFSLGGAIAVSARPSGVYKVGVAFYPGCKFHRAAGAGNGTAPLLILAGGRDSYGDGTSCEDFARAIGASVKIYPGVHHGFDRAGAISAPDPRADGKVAVLKYNAAAAADARTRMVAFFRQHL